jgi:hypothetical protein
VITVAALGAFKRCRRSVHGRRRGSALASDSGIADRQAPTARRCHVQWNIRPRRPGGTQSCNRGRVQSLVQIHHRATPRLVLPSHRQRPSSSIPGRAACAGEREVSHLRGHAQPRGLSSEIASASWWGTLALFDGGKFAVGNFQGTCPQSDKRHAAGHPAARTAKSHTFTHRSRGPGLRVPRRQL